jgi:hypothetical protein
VIQGDPTRSNATGSDASGCRGKRRRRRRRRRRKVGPMEEEEEEKEDRAHEPKRVSLGPCPTDANKKNPKNNWSRPPPP